MPDPSDTKPAFGVLQAGILFLVLFALLCATTLTVAKISTKLENQQQHNEARVAAKDWSQIIGSSRVHTQHTLSVMEGMFAGAAPPHDDATPFFPNCTRRPAAPINFNRVSDVVNAVASRAIDGDLIRAAAFLPGGVYYPSLMFTRMPYVASRLNGGVAGMYKTGNATVGYDVAAHHIQATTWNNVQITPVFYRGLLGLPLRPMFTVPAPAVSQAERCRRFLGFVGAAINITRVWEKAGQFLYANHPNYDLIVKRSKGTPFVYIRNRTTHDTIVNEGVAIPTSIGNLQTIYMYPHGGFTTFSTKIIATCLLGSATVSLVTVLVVTIAACVWERIMVQRLESKARKIPRQAPFAIIATEIHNAKAAWRSHPKEMGEALRKVNEELRALASSHDVFEARLINDGALFVAQSPTDAVAFAQAAVQWSNSTTWPAFARSDSVGPLALKVATHWCKDARIKSHSQDRFNIDVSGTDVLLGAALRSAVPVTAALVTGDLCVALNVHFTGHTASHSSNINPLTSNSAQQIHAGASVAPGRMRKGPLMGLLFFPLGTTPWRQRTVAGFIVLPKTNPEVSSRAQSLLEHSKVVAGSVTPGSPVPLAELNPLADPGSCLASVFSAAEIQALKPYWGGVGPTSASTAPTATIAGAGLSKMSAGDVGGDGAMAVLLSDVDAIKENYAADWLPARACKWPVAKVMLDGKEGYASQVPRSQQLVALTIGTFFYQAYTLAFSPLQGSEQRAVFRRLQVVFGIPERRFLPHLALRCGAICWQQLYGERVGSSKHQSHLSTPRSESVLEASGMRRSARSRLPTQ